MNIVGITSCIAGLAHTYLAAESLERYGKEHGHNVKIETQGQIGVENKLTSDEIAAADIVVIASDLGVTGADRFEGKKVLKIKLSDAIRKVDGVYAKIEKTVKE